MRFEKICDRTFQLTVAHMMYEEKGILFIVMVTDAQQKRFTHPNHFPPRPTTPLSSPNYLQIDKFIYHRSRVGDISQS